MLRLNLLGAVTRRYFAKKVLLEFAQNSQENTCARVSFLKKSVTLSKKRLSHRCFPANFVKFLRTPFITRHVRWLLLAYSYAHTQMIFLLIHFQLLGNWERHQRDIVNCERKLSNRYKNYVAEERGTEKKQPFPLKGTVIEIKYIRWVQRK